MTTESKTEKRLSRIASGQKVNFPPSVDWLGKTIPGYGNKESQVRVWKMVLQYEKDHQLTLRPGNKNNVILSLPNVKDYTRPISIGALLEVFGIPRYTEDHNGAYHPRQAAKVLASVGYQLVLSEATSTPAKLTKTCVKCKQALPNKAQFCFHCGMKQPALETVKGKVEVKPEVKPAKKARKSNRPTGKAILEVTPKPEQVITLPELPPSMAELDQQAVIVPTEEVKAE